MLNVMENRNQRMQDKEQSPTHRNSSINQTHKLKVNRNGFANPITFWQISPLIFGLFMTAETYYAANLLQIMALKVAMMLLISLASFCCSVLWVLASKIDPSDSIQLLHN